MRAATHHLMAAMEKARDELKLAIKYDNDVEDKIADCANYLGFILHNRQEKP